MDRRRCVIRNPVLSIPWGYKANDGNLRQIQHLHEPAGIFYLDKKNGALDLRTKKSTKSLKNLNKTINMLRKRQYLESTTRGSSASSSGKTLTERQNSTSTTPLSSQNRNNSSTVSSTDTASFSSTNGNYNKKLKAVKNNDEARNRRKARIPRKRVALRENRDPFEVYRFTENEENIVPLPYKKRKQNRKQKVGVVLKLRNHQYVSTLL